MSVFVSNFNPGDGSWIIVHDELGHTGAIDPTEIIYTKNPDNSDNHNFAIIHCLECDSVSTHPVGGGAQPESVQEMFVHMAYLNGCPCGKLAAGRSSTETQDHIKIHCEEMDGPGRWKLDGVTIVL
jgi:hypothetical protein